MKAKTRSLIIVFVLLLVVSIGYAYLSANLDVLGIANVKKVKWNIFLSSLEVTSGKEFEVVSPVVTGTKTTSIDYKVVLENPGDIYSFDIDVVNDGTIDAMISLVNNSELTEEQQRFTRYSVTYKDGAPVQEKNFLGSYSRDTFTISLEFRQDIEIEDLPSSDNEIELNLSLEYVQAKESDNRVNKSTLVNDLSGNNNKGIIYGAKINDDGTITTDGIDDYIDCGLANYNFGNQVSIIARVKFYKLGTKELFGNWENAGLGLAIHENKIKFNIYVNNKYEIFSTKKSVSTSNWYTIVGVYDGSKMSLYVNGEKVVNSNDEDSLAVTGNIKPSSMPLYLGANPETYGVLLPAYVDISQALIFDRALSEEEISKDYGIEINPTDNTGMLFYYDFSK